MGVDVVVPRMRDAENVGFPICGLKLAVTPAGKADEIDRVTGVVLPLVRLTFTV